MIALSAEVCRVIEDWRDHHRHEVEDEVNRAVGRVVLHPYTDPSKYRFTQEGYSVVFEKVEEAKDSGK